MPTPLGILLPIERGNGGYFSQGYDTLEQVKSMAKEERRSMRAFVLHLIDEKLLNTLHLKGLTKNKNSIEVQKCK